jgi:hypothetical protein
VKTFDEFLAETRHHREHCDGRKPTHQLTHKLAREIYLADCARMCAQSREEYVANAGVSRSYRDWATEALAELPAVQEGYYCSTCLTGAVAECLSYFVLAGEFGLEFANEEAAEQDGWCRGGPLEPLICRQCGRALDEDGSCEEVGAAAS